MTDEATPADDLTYDKDRCLRWSKRIFKAGLESEWFKFKAKNCRRSDSKAEYDLRVQTVKMMFLPRLQEVEATLAQESAKPENQRRQHLMNLVPKVEPMTCDRLEWDRDWAAANLFTPPNMIEASKVPSRRALSILIAAIDDATLRRSLLTPERRQRGKAKNADSASGSNDAASGSAAVQQPVDPQVARLKERLSRMEKTVP